MYRVGTDWYMHAIGEGAHGKQASENVDELQDFLRRTGLAGGRVADGNSGPPGMPTRPPQKKPDLVVSVPAGVKPGQKMQMQTPDGYTMQVAVPASARPGQQLQVAQPVVYTQ